MKLRSKQALCCMLSAALMLTAAVIPATALPASRQVSAAADTARQDGYSTEIGNIRVQTLSDTLARVEVKGPEGFEDRETYHITGRDWEGVSAQVTEAEQMAENDSYVPVDPDIPYGFVAVAAGMGVQSLFEDLGVNNVVTGGQTMNPSTDDILNAIHATPAQTVFVLPNNKNIIMAAEQAVKLADRRVCVLQTVTIPQGISAMLAFDPEASFADNQVNMTEAASRVQSGQITFAARDSDYDGHNIKAGEILAMENGKLAFVEKDLEKAVYKLTRSMVRRDSSFVTLIYGSDVTDGQAESACEFIKSKLSPNLEISLINGGQPVYYYLISVE